MSLVIKELDFEKSQRFIVEEFGNELLLTKLPFFRQLLETGDFFTVIPDDVKGEKLHEFKTGGKIYAFFRPDDVTVMSVRNDSEGIFTSSLSDYLIQSNRNFIGIEDYSASPNANYIKENKLEYHLLSNSHLFYLLNNDLTPVEVLKHYSFSKGIYFYV
jgi:hypothetical protein